MCRLIRFATPSSADLPGFSGFLQHLGRKLLDYLYEQDAFKPSEYNGNIKGMIYFTDGYGTFPSRKPNYQTAFVFIQDEYNNLDVPPWAIKLILEKDELAK